MMNANNRTKEPIVVFDNVSKHFRRKAALENISFSLPRNQIVGLIGTNGSGKSTLLKLMTGLLRPSEGRVLFQGRPVERLDSRQIAFLPEQDVYYALDTVEQTLIFYNEMYSDFSLEKAQELVRYFQLDAAQEVAALSKGNRARLKIILVLSRSAPLLVMDEPLSGLDPLVRESIIQSLAAFVDLENQTLVISTHEVVEIEPMLDSALLIKNSKLLGFEAVDDIRQQRGYGLIDWMRTV